MSAQPLTPIPEALLCTRCHQTLAVWRGLCLQCRDKVNPSAAIQDRALMLLRDLVARGMARPGVRYEFVCSFTADDLMQIESYEIALRDECGALAFRQGFGSGADRTRGRVVRFKRWLAALVR